MGARAAEWFSVRSGSGSPTTTTGRPGVRAIGSDIVVVSLWISSWDLTCLRTLLVRSAGHLTNARACVGSGLRSSQDGSIGAQHCWAQRCAAYKRHKWRTYVVSRQLVHGQLKELQKQGENLSAQRICWYTAGTCCCTRAWRHQQVFVSSTTAHAKDTAI